MRCLRRITWRTVAGAADGGIGAEAGCGFATVGAGQDGRKRRETLVGIGAPGWDRTSNPCLRRAVLYPLSYGRDVSCVDNGGRRRRKVA